MSKTLIVLGIIAMVLLIGTGIVYQCASERNRDTIEFVAAGIGTIAAVITLGQATAKLDAESRQLRVNAALALITRWNSSEFEQLRDRYGEIARRVDDKQQLELLENERADRRTVEDVLNFLEEVAYCANNDVADDSLLQKMLGPLLSQAHDDWRPWIEKRRSENPDYWAELRALRGRWDAPVGPS